MIRLGTRGSLLARTQSGIVADAITRVTGEPCELVAIRTEGDNLNVPLDAPSRPGAFVSALRDALLAGEVDVVVHSFKDLPSAPVAELRLAAVPPREDSRDALVSRGSGLAELPAGSRVGTSSPRRRAAVARLRPDLDVVPLRGNVDTRLARVDAGAVEAAILAAAGLSRLGRTARITEYLDPLAMLPAPAQGALAVECRDDTARSLVPTRSDSLADALATLDDPTARVCVTAERAVLRGIEAACTTAVGAHATWQEGRLTVTAELSDHRGVEYARAARSCAMPFAEPGAAENLGLQVAEALLGGGDA